MFEFIKKMSRVTISFFSCNALKAIPMNAIPLKYVSVKDQECRIRLEIISINISEPTYILSL